MYSEKNLLSSSYELRVNISQLWIFKIFLLRKENQKKRKTNKNYLRYSFEILENLWKERTKCTAGIKQMHQKLKQFFGDFSHSLITGEILWENKKSNKGYNSLTMRSFLSKRHLWFQREEISILWFICEKLGLWDA